MEELQISSLQYKIKDLQGDIKNLFQCKNQAINKQLLGSFYNFFFVYQKEIVEGLINDLLLEEVMNLNSIEDRD